MMWFVLSWDKQFIIQAALLFGVFLPLKIDNAVQSLGRKPARDNRNQL